MTSTFIPSIDIQKMFITSALKYEKTIYNAEKDRQLASKEREKAFCIACATYAMLLEKNPVVYYHEKDEPRLYWTYRAIDSIAYFSYCLAVDTADAIYYLAHYLAESAHYEADAERELALVSIDLLVLDSDEDPEV